MRRANKLLICISIISLISCNGNLEWLRDNDKSSANYLSTAEREFTWFKSQVQTTVTQFRISEFALGLYSIKAHAIYSQSPKHIKEECKNLGAYLGVESGKGLIDLSMENIQYVISKSQDQLFKMQAYFLLGKLFDEKCNYSEIRNFKPAEDKKTLEQYMDVLYGILSLSTHIICQKSLNSQNDYNFRVEHLKLTLIKLIHLSSFPEDVKGFFLDLYKKLEKDPMLIIVPYYDTMASHVSKVITFKDLAIQAQIEKSGTVKILEYYTNTLCHFIIVNEFGGEKIHQYRQVSEYIPLILKEISGCLQGLN